MISNKKFKMSKDTFERDRRYIEELREHILSVRKELKESCAVKAAMNGLEKEMQRIQRDEKLSRKFSKMSDKKSDDSENECEIKEVTEKCSDDDSELLVEYDVVTNQRKSPEKQRSHKNDSPSSLMEWQDVSTDVSAGGGGADTESLLGKKLSEISISKMAEEDVRVSSALSAFAVAFHSALLSDLLNFKCTGMIENKQKKEASNTSNGFAKPIRELPKNKFLPDEFFQCSYDVNEIKLRYRKTGYGGVILKLSSTNSCDEELEKDRSQNISVNTQITKVEFYPNSDSYVSEPNSQGALMFPTSKHFNLDSFNAALSNNLSGQGRRSTNTILPALHYKRLALLMSNFVKTFDLGNLNDNDDSNKPDADVSWKSAPSNIHNNNPITTSRAASSTSNSSSRHDLLRVPRQGHFDSDLLPVGIGGRNNDPIVPSMGNLMGPNHPMFHRRDPMYHDDDDDGSNHLFPPGHGGINPPSFGLPHPGLGNLEMQPRFDPYGPPGLGVGPPGKSNKNKKGSRFGGRPNNDHQRPPSEYDDMFM